MVTIQSRPHPHSAPPHPLWRIPFRCDWAKNRKRWLLTARANRKHRQKSFFFCAFVAVIVVAVAVWGTRAIGEHSFVQRGPHGPNHRRPSALGPWPVIRFSAKGAPETFSRLHLWGTGEPLHTHWSVHTRRHGEVLTTAAGAQQTRKA